MQFFNTRGTTEATFTFSHTHVRHFENASSIQGWKGGRDESAGSFFEKGENHKWRTDRPHSETIQTLWNARTPGGGRALSSPYINGNVHAATGKTKLLMYLTAFIAQFCRNFKAKAQLPSFPSPSLPIYFAAYLHSGVLQRGEHKFEIRQCLKKESQSEFIL